MGASIIQSGLIPTLAFYSDTDKDNNKNSGGDEPKQYLLDIIGDMLGHKNLFGYALSLKEGDNPQKRLRKLKRDVIHVSIALKLVLRTFKMVESKKTDNKKEETERTEA